MSMTGLWLVSYVILWVIVITLLLLVLGILRLVGSLNSRITLESSADDSIPSIAADGPEIGSSMPKVEAPSLVGSGTVSLPEPGKGALLIFMSHMCSSCQSIVDSLNQLGEEQTSGVPVTVFLRADERGTQAFLTVYGLQVPTISDGETIWTRAFSVHRSPFALYYDEKGVLVRKGTVAEGMVDLLAVLGRSSADPRLQEHVYPLVTV
jgi:hypothetical protein